MSAPHEQSLGPRGRGRGRVGDNNTPSPSRPTVVAAGRDEPSQVDPRPKEVGGDGQSSGKQPSSRITGKGRARPKKPEMQRYVPRGRREREHEVQQPQQPVSCDGDQCGITQDVSGASKVQTDTFEMLMPSEKTQQFQDVEAGEHIQQPKSDQTRSKKGHKSARSTNKLDEDGSTKRSRPEVQLYVPRGRRKTGGEDSSETKNSKHPSRGMKNHSPNKKESHRVKASSSESDFIPQQCTVPEDQMDLTSHALETSGIKGAEYDFGTEDQSGVEQHLESMSSASQPQMPSLHADVFQTNCAESEEIVEHYTTPSHVVHKDEDLEQVIPSGDTFLEPDLKEEDGNVESRDQVNSLRNELLSDLDSESSCVQGSSLPESLPFTDDKHNLYETTGALSSDIQGHVISQSESKVSSGTERARLQQAEPSPAMTTNNCIPLKAENMEIEPAEMEKSRESVRDNSVIDEHLLPREQNISDHSQEVKDEVHVHSASEQISDLATGHSASCSRDYVAAAAPREPSYNPNLTSTDSAATDQGFNSSDSGEYVKEKMDIEMVEPVEGTEEAGFPDGTHVTDGSDSQQRPDRAPEDSSGHSESSAACQLTDQLEGVKSDSHNKHTNSTDQNSSHIMHQATEDCYPCDSGDATPVKERKSPEDPPAVSEQVTATLTKINQEEEEEDSWDKIFDDNGDCLDPSMMAELTAHVGEVKISKAKKINYLDYQPKEADMDLAAYNHVIEISEFPVEFQTRDLLTAFKDYMARGFDIKWVDDTHALGVFSSSIAAQEALKLVHPMMKVRPLSEASKQSRNKARRCQEFLQPYKARPETTAVAARRLVAGALGMTSRISKEQRDEERKKLREAKEKKKLDRKQKEAIWDGTFGRCAMDD